MPRPHRLTTIAFSHYNEKARWALDWCGVPYEESRWMPGFSHGAVLAATRGRGGQSDKVSSPLSTPVLVTSSGEALCDSTDIARWASTRAAGVGPGPLFPTPEVLELVDAFGREIGPRTRLVAYFHVLRSKTAMRRLAENNVGAGQALAFRGFAPLGVRMIQRGLGVTKEAADRAVVRVREQLAKVEQRLDRGPYLVGRSFTAADLTFASLLAPALLVTRAEGYGATFPSLDELGDDARALVEEMRGTRAGRFALDVYAKHRRERWACATETRASAT